MPGGARTAAIAALAHADRYPDPTCRALRAAIARRYVVPESLVLVGNGAGDLIDRIAIAMRPRKALVTAPTFGEYRFALERMGCAVEAYELDAGHDFALDHGILARIRPGLDVLVLCEPNNPTGRTTERALLEEIATRCDEANTLLVVDECFMDFVADPQGQSLLGVVAHHRMLVLRAFTKFWGMAGLRLGWCACASESLVRAMAQAAQPWAVSTVAQEAGIAALKDEGYARRVRELVCRERAALAHRLADLGCRVVPGEANYLLFRDPTPHLAATLEDRGILIRDCSDFEGLGPGWYRVAVRTAPENAQLVAALEVAHL